MLQQQDGKEDDPKGIRLHERLYGIEGRITPLQINALFDNQLVVLLYGKQSVDPVMTVDHVVPLSLASPTR